MDHAPRVASADRTRRLLRGVSITFAIGVCGIRTIPVSSDTLLTLASNARRFGPVSELLFSTLKQTPFQRCSAITASQDKLTANVRTTVANVWKLPAEYNRRTLRLYEADCPEAPRFSHSYVDYQYSFAYAAPYAWVIEQFGITEIYIALLVDRTNELYSGHAILRDGSA